MSRLGKLEGAEKRYPVPPNGRVLESEHLRELALFVLATGARRRVGEWGLYRPRDDGEEGEGRETNRVTIEDKELVIRKVALICREGVEIRVDEARARFSSGGGNIYIAWNMPEDSDGGVESDGGVTVELCIEKRPEGTVIVKLGRIVPPEIAAAPMSREHVQLDVPALGLDASSELDGAWTTLGGALMGLAVAVNNSQQGSAYDRLEVGASLRKILDMPRHFDPAHATWELRATTRRLENFVKAHRGEFDDAAEHEAAALSRAADECLDGAGMGLDPLIKAIRETTSTGTAEVERWLRPSREMLPEANVHEAGNLEMLYFKLPEEPDTVEIEFSGGEEAEVFATISYEIAGEWQEPEPLTFEDSKRPGIAVLRISDGAGRFRIRCESGLKVKATQYPKLETEPSEPLQTAGDAP